MYCINCNKEVDKEAKACPYCGTDFTEKPKPAKEKGNHNCECHDCKCNNCDCNDKKATNATLVGVLIVVLLLLLGLAAIATIVIGGSYIFRKDEKNNHEQKEVKDKVTWDGLEFKIPDGYKYKYKEDCIEIYNKDVLYDIQVDDITYNDAKAKKNELLKTVKINNNEELTITSVEVEIYDYREYIVAKGENDTYRYVYLITTSSETSGTISIAAVYKIGASNDQRVINEATKIIKGIKSTRDAGATIAEERALNGLLGESDGIDNEASEEDFDRDLFRALEF